MSENQPQEIITFKPRLVKVIKERETMVLLNDKNLSFLMLTLRKKNTPITLEEISDAFEEAGNKKSIKTLYRYINALIKADLIKRAGKRLIVINGEIKSLTLYSRTAKIYFFGMDDHPEIIPEKIKQDLEIIGLLVGKQLEMNSFSIECLDKFLFKLNSRRKEFIEEFLANPDDKIISLLENTDHDHTGWIFNMVSLLVLFTDQEDWQKGLVNCFKKIDSDQ